MKRYLTTLGCLVCLLSMQTLQAQDRHEIVVDRFAQLQNEISSENRFVFSDFTKGTVYFKNGNKAFGVFNYDMLQQEILFKEGENTLAFKDKSALMIDIGSYRYIPLVKGYAEVMLDGEVSLLIDRKLLSESYKEGGYIGHSNTAASSSLSDVGGSNPLNTSLPSKIVVKKNDEFYLLKNGKLWPASKKNYLRCYPSLTTELEDFLKKNKVKFNDYNDLYQLSKYCNLLMIGGE